MKYTHIEVIKRGCCKTIFAGCAIHPDAMDEEWTKSKMEAIEKGCTIDIVKCNSGQLQFSECICNKEIIDPNQTALF